MRIRIALTTDPVPLFILIQDQDPDLVPHRSDANPRPLVYRPSMAPFSEPLELQNFDFNADPDPAFQTNADPRTRTLVFTPMKICTGNWVSLREAVRFLKGFDTNPTRPGFMSVRGAQLLNM